MMNEKDIMNTSVIFDAVKGKFIGSVGDKVVIRTKDKAAADRIVAKIARDFAEASNVVTSKVERYGINERFAFVEQLVSMVASGVQPSAVITGEGGLGKTYTVTKTLEDHGLMDISDLAEFQAGTVLNSKKCFTFVKGYSTARGLYTTLFENNGSVIVSDDCDSILKDPVALNILKSALDSYGKRIISWNAESRDPELPRSFVFTGRIIFLSNLPQEKIDQAIRSRSILIDLSMTKDQKIDRMEHISKEQDFMPEYDKNIVSDALDLLREIKDEARELSLRTLISVCKIRASNKNWKDMARYVLC